MTPNELIEMLGYCYRADLVREAKHLAKHLKQPLTADHVRTAAAVMIQKPKLATALTANIGPLVDDPNPVQRLRRDDP